MSPLLRFASVLGLALAAGVPGVTPLLAQGESGRPGGQPRAPRGGPMAGWTDDQSTQTARLSPRGSLEIKAWRGEVVVNGISGDVVRVAATKRVMEPNKENARAVLQSLRVQVIERGGGVDVVTEVPEGRMPPTVVNYVIGVPVSANVLISNWGGEIRVVNVKGEVRVEANGVGDVNLSSIGRVRKVKSLVGNVTIAGAEGEEVNAETLNGRLQVRDIKARTVELSSIGGAVSLTDTMCDRCAVTTVSGAIEFNGQLTPESRYSLKTQSGDIRVITNATTSFDLDAMSGGRLTSDFDLRRIRPAAPGAQRRILRGVYDAGTGAAIVSLASFAGNISVLRRTDPR